jgi:hypothetical protein
MNWYKSAQTIKDPSKPNISSSPVIEDKSIYWQFNFLNMPLKVNVDQIIRRASDYLKAINSAIFQNTEAVKAVGTSPGLAHVSSDKPWTINVDFGKMENEVKQNIQHMLHDLENQQMRQLSPEELQEMKSHPEKINKAFVEGLTKQIQDEVVREYAQMIAHEARHNLQMDSTKSEIEQSKIMALDRAKAILQKVPQKDAALERDLDAVYRMPLNNENRNQFNAMLSRVFKYVIDTSDAKALNDAVMRLNQIKYMPESQAESEAEQAEKVVL